MKRIVLLTFVFLLALPVIFLKNDMDVVSICKSAEAATTVSLKPAERELKREKKPYDSSIYARMHHIIYGKEAPIGPEDRIKIAVVINGEADLMEDRIKNQIYKQLSEKFPRDKFCVEKGIDVNTKLLTYEENIYNENYKYEHGYVRGENSWQFDNNEQIATKNDRSITSGKLDVDGMPVVGRPREYSELRLDDYVRAGKECGYDYVFAMTLTPGASKRESHNLIIYHSVTNRKQVWLRARFVDVANSNYLYRNDMVAEGESHNDMINGRIMERSVAKIMQEAMNDIEIVE